ERTVLRAQMRSSSGASVARQATALAVLLMILAGAPAWTAEPLPRAQPEEMLPAIPTLPADALLLTQQKKKENEAHKSREAAVQPAEPDLFANAPHTPHAAPSGINPNMIGDLFGYSVLKTITIPTTRTLFIPPKFVPGNEVPIPGKTITITGAITETI